MTQPLTVEILIAHLCKRLHLKEGDKKVKKQRKWMSISLIFVLLVSLFSNYVPSTEANANVSSPVLNQDGTVTFFYNDNVADRVRVAGGFTNWQDNALEMVESEGVWSVTTGVLTPNTYQYKLIVNEDQWILDPLNNQESGGNSLLVIEGLNLDQNAALVEVGSEIALKAQKINGDGSQEDISTTVNWTLQDSASGVEIVNGSNLRVSTSATVGSVVKVEAEQDGYKTTKELTISEKLNEYTVNYYRTDNNLDSWDMWIFDGGYAAAGYEFQSINGTDYKFAKGVHRFPGNEIKIIPRKGDWETQDNQYIVQMPENSNSTEVWLVQGFATIFTSEESAIDALVGPPPAQRKIQFVYERNNGDYDDWNMWTWQTGVSDGQKDFQEITEKGAVSTFEIGPNTTSVGFVLRQGTDWVVKDPFGEDRYINAEPSQMLTKVFVKEGVEEIRIVPSVNGPRIDDGNITFYYRDQELYEQNAMNTLDGVKVKVSGEEYEMVYNPENEYFAYTLENASEGSYQYSFLVTVDGETRELNDPFNTDQNGESIVEFFNPDIKLSTELTKSSIDYSENTVLAVSVDQPELIQELYIDVTSLGGTPKLDIDLSLMSQTIAVNDSVTAGKKQLPLTLVDIYGNKHTEIVELTVVPKQAVGDIGFDWDEARIYFMLTDRFENGDLANDDPNGANYDLSHPETYHGGDFQGIIDRLDYLEDLGINTIWITPIVDNIEWDLRYDKNGNQFAYHGYWADDFTKLDEHLGDLDTFKELIDKAHDRGIKLMVDVVLNHTGYGLKENDPSNSLNIPLYPTDEDRKRFEGMLRDGGTDVIQGELAGLPDLITEDAIVRDQIIKWQTDWLEKAQTDRGDTIDYFRVDTVKHVDDTTWKAFKNELTKIKPDFKMIGEHYGATINNTGGYLNSGQMDSLLDFDFKYQAESFINGDLEQVAANLEYRNNNLTSSATLGQFLSSHDENGFLTERADGDISKLMVAAALQITAKGQPVIYYGEELGQSGDHAGNMDAGEFNENRDDMPWEEFVNGNETMVSLHNHYQKLLNIRKEFSKTFSKGTRATIAGSDAEKYLVFERNYKNQSVYVGLNVDTEANQSSFTVNYPAGTTLTDLYNGLTYTVSEEQKLTVDIPSRANGGTVILVAQESDEQDPGNGDGATPPGNGDGETPPGKGDEGTIPNQPKEVKPTIKNGIVTIETSMIELLKDKAQLEVNVGRNTVFKVAFTEEQVKLLKIKGIQTVISNNDVELHIPTSNLPNKAFEIHLTKMKPMKEALSEIYDFKLTVNGTEYHIFDEMMTLVFKIDSEKVKNPNNVTVLYFNEDKNQWEDMGGIYKDGVVTAQTSHFSIYGGFERFEESEKLSEIPGPKGENKLPSTATNSFNLLMVGILFSIAGALIVLFQMRRSKGQM
ncbi:Glycosidase [Litchfieldia salsa]|uniref:pullulanase n=1 Tax=Litchfieldia salsa TaxID=930152 RepID=A0A1H0RT33_9BACI|nr:Glycosidase [Litchfieldia salsa]